jgi:hypothetical protein
MGVGLIYPASATALRIEGCKFNDSNVTEDNVVSLSKITKKGASNNDMYH